MTLLYVIATVNTRILTHILISWHFLTKNMFNIHSLTSVLTSIWTLVSTYTLTSTQTCSLTYFLNCIHTYTLISTLTYGLTCNLANLMWQNIQRDKYLDMDKVFLNNTYIYYLLCFLSFIYIYISLRHLTSEICDIWNTSFSPSTWPLQARTILKKTHPYFYVYIYIYTQYIIIYIFWVMIIIYIYIWVNEHISLTWKNVYLGTQWGHYVYDCMYMTVCI